MLNWFESPTNVELAAFAATLACTWGSAFLAFRAPRKSPRLFLALGLFALNWAVLLLYYMPGSPQNEILSSYSGLILIYTGVLLLHEARAAGDNPEPASVCWQEKLPLFLFRATVGGLGVHLIALRFFRINAGWGTLALALWGTLLTVLGYGAVWLGVNALYGGSPQRRRIGVWLGALLAAYSCCEISFAVWYARESWPQYQRYAALQSRKSSPDLEEPLPFRAASDWPEAEKWRGVQAETGSGEGNRLLRLHVTPQLPKNPLWLEYAFAVLKLAFTAAFFYAIWRRPAEACVAAADRDGDRVAYSPARRAS